ncbi:phage antirepressor KilAC domain-containing protein [Paraburkholderia tuberum]|uniref:phage antirepressor KilAC domain-containing protein n=1 Tax=Paraburkholderia tuberum TaxID=157910 RepID=UPI001ABC813B|nr:phage antirepressor KilAC domain-containing protein [Paraburkholderia tuberum]
MSRTIGDEHVQTVNARDLHSFLEVSKDFSDWIKVQLGEMFAQGIDFEVFPLKGENSTRPRIEYALTLECAKHVAMMSRCAKGKQVRDYFIECERRAKAVDPMQMLGDPAAMRGLLLTYTEKVLVLESKVAEQAPKVEALERIATANGSLCVTDAAKALQESPKRFFAWLQQIHWIYRRAGTSSWLGYQEKVQAGFLEHKVTEVSRSDGSEKLVEQVRVTPKGLTRLAHILASN